MKSVKSRMSTVHFIFGTFLAACLLCASGTASAQQGPIGPFKDDLFSRMKVLETADGGAFEVIDYREMRDINGRDSEPERRVKRAYVSLGVRREQTDLTVMEGRRHAQNVTRVGDPETAEFAVIFIHGRGGDRRLGVNDYTFGGNFNRLKNLVAGNGGVYYSPSVASFDQRGVDDIKALIGYASYRPSGQPQRPVILACASMGGFICSGVARDPQAAALLKGMVILGGPPDSALATSALAKAARPIYFAHGSADSVYKAEDQIRIYRGLRKAGQPVRFTVFATGGHGTPIRMVDWRKVLNFTLIAHR
jgi:hypothetical protein